MRIESSRCLQCNNKLDAVTESTGDNLAPDENSISICFYCGHLAMFDSQLRLREPSPEELQNVLEELKKDSPSTYSCLLIARAIFANKNKPKG